MNKPKRGQTFVHDQFKDLGWTPGLEQKWTDAPNATMVITRVTPTAIYYRFSDGLGKTVMDLQDFMERYGDKLL